MQSGDQRCDVKVLRALRLWPLLLPLVILVPVLKATHTPLLKSRYSDLTLAHYPYIAYQRSSLWEGNRLPLWSPVILSGGPLAANPLASVWYPPGWLTLVAPLPLGFNLGMAAHLLWGGIGLYLLMRREGCSRPAALLAGLAFIALPKLFAHYGAGHLTLLYAVPWTPWLLYAARRSSERGFWPWLPSFVLALIFLADPRWAPYAGALWWGYSLFQRGSDDERDPLPGTTHRLLMLSGQSILAIFLAAPLVLPLLEYARLSSRVLMTAEDVFRFSLPPLRLLGLVFPDFGGFHEWILYPGALILILSMLALIWRKSIPGVGFWIGSATLSLLFSLGSSIPLLPILANLPLINLLRVPSRGLFVSGLSLAALAAYSLDRLMEPQPSMDIRPARLGLVLLNTLTISFAVGLWLISGAGSRNLLWGAMGVLLASIWIIMRLVGRITHRIWYLVLVAFCLLDWGMLSRSLFDARSPQDVFSEARELASYLAHQPGYFRVYSPSYSLPQHIAAKNHLQLADGIDPLQLLSYIEFMQSATGVPWDGYSVALPPFATGEPLTDNAGYRPDPVLMGWINVRYIAAEYDLSQDGLVLVNQFGGTRLYENSHFLPRAWVQPLEAPIGQDANPVEIVSWIPERAEIISDGPGLLVLSELAYPGWRAWIDGELTDVVVVEDLFRAVELGPGQHQVVFAYRPRSLFWGLGLLLIALFFVLVSFYRFSRAKIVSESVSG